LKPALPRKERMPLIEPKPNHVLFFPTRKGQRVFSEAVHTFFLTREKYKHVKIEHFDVILQFGKPESASSSRNNPPAKTKDNLFCNIVATFPLTVIRDDKSLEKSTSGFPASRKPQIVDSVFFEKGLRVQLQSLIERSVGNVEYLTFLIDAHSKKGLEDAVLKDAAVLVNQEGFQLRGGRVDIELIDPSPESLTTKELQDKWHDYLTRKAAFDEITLSVADKTELKRLEREKETAEKRRVILEEKNKTDNKCDIDRQNGLEERDKELSRIVTRRMESEKIEKEVQAKIAASIREIDQEVQRQATIAENNLASLKAAKEHEEAMEALRREKELDQLRLELAELKGLIAKATEAQIRIVGSAEAEIERLKRLAEQAVALESRKVLYEALPSVLQAAFSPTQKLTDVKCIYMGHPGSDQADDSSGAKSADGLGSMLATMSTLPMLREVLRFLDDSQDAKGATDRPPTGSPGRPAQS
jgi:flotillin-like protein